MIPDQAMRFLPFDKAQNLQQAQGPEWNEGERSLKAFGVADLIRYR